MPRTDTGLTDTELETILNRIEDARLKRGITQKAAHGLAMAILGRKVNSCGNAWSGAVGQTRGVSMPVIRAMAQAVGLDLRITIRPL